MVVPVRRPQSAIFSDSSGTPTPSRAPSYSRHSKRSRHRTTWAVATVKCAILFCKHRGTREAGISDNALPHRICSICAEIRLFDCSKSFLSQCRYFAFCPKNFWNYLWDPSEADTYGWDTHAETAANDLLLQSIKGTDQQRSSLILACHAISPQKYCLPETKATACVSNL